MLKMLHFVYYRGWSNAVSNIRIRFYIGPSMCKRTSILVPESSVSPLFHNYNNILNKTTNQIPVTIFFRRNLFSTIVWVLMRVYSSHISIWLSVNVISVLPQWFTLCQYLNGNGNDVNDDDDDENGNNNEDAYEMKWNDMKTQQQRHDCVFLFISL